MEYSEVATRSGLSQAVVANLFSRAGDPRLSTIKPLCLALGMTFDPVAILTAARQGRTVTWMAEAAGIGRTGIDRLFTGKDCQLSVATTVAVVLGCSVDPVPVPDYCRSEAARMVPISMSAIPIAEQPAAIERYARDRWLWTLGVLNRKVVA